LTSKRTDIRFDVPLYTVSEAARALGVPVPTFTTWARGYERRPPGRRPVRGAAVVTAFPAVSGRPSVPFVGLAEGVVLAAVRQAGVPLQRVRPALARLSREIGLSHALASKRLFTDGAEILFDYSKRARSQESEVINDLVVVRSGQRVFSDVVRNYLSRITYDTDGYASLIRLPGYGRADVVADAKRAFGQPIFSHGAARVNDVLDRFWAGDAIESLSEEFGVSDADIEDVLRAFRPAA
jgi:uncharacterized protein (DUF433 family)